MESLGGGKGELLTVTNRDYYFMSKDELAALRPGEPLPGTFLLSPRGATPRLRWPWRPTKWSSDTALMP